MSQTNVFRFKSTEWAMAFWVYVVAAIVLASVLTGIHTLIGKENIAFADNIFILIMIIALAMFNKKLFTSEAEVFIDEHGNLVMRWIKIGGNKERIILKDKLQKAGKGKTDAVSGIFNVPAKEWIMFEGMGRKYYFYEENLPHQRNKLMPILKKHFGNFEFVDNIMQ